MQQMEHLLCVEQPIQFLFFSQSATLGYCMYGGDAVDAFAHSPPPVKTTHSVAVLLSVSYPWLLCVWW